MSRRGYVIFYAGCPIASHVDGMVKLNPICSEIIKDYGRVHKSRDSHRREGGRSFSSTKELIEREGMTSTERVHSRVYEGTPSPRRHRTKRHLHRASSDLRLRSRGTFSREA
eukprot:scaffold43790_cov38-Cyclotella_meneghiniana.AAC.9